ncbi:hypothetical protein [Bacillus pinisoli]|uniref:hypothetical protein n=1 Tax=Bacillus pinisoli TaxID=2901866 RepID=UPI001FF2545E|nr:hypothetical protein [Bacillus pinisoli]
MFRGGHLKKIKWVIIAVPFIILLIFAATYIPHKVVDMDASNVSKITIFDGNTGYEMDITDKSNITYIIKNLNEVTFQKGKSSFGYMGFSFNTTIFDHDGKVIQNFIINSTDTIRYKGFFYRAKDQLIDYDYIEQLVRNQ